MLYAKTKEKRHLWIKRIKANLNRLSNYDHYCSLHSHHYLTNNIMTSNVHYSVLNRLLDKLYLYDGSDNDSAYFQSKYGRKYTSSASKYKSNESINIIDYNNSI